MSPTELTKVLDAPAEALSVGAVNQLGRDTGPAVRLRTVTPQRLFPAVVSAPAGCARFMRSMLARPIDRLRLETLTPEGELPKA